MIPTLSQVCTLNAPVETEIEDFAAAKCQSVEAWLTKLEAYLEHHSIEQLEQLLEKTGVRLRAASLQGGLLTSQGAARAEAWSLLERRLQLCGRLQIPVLVVACDIGYPLQQGDLQRAQQSLGELAQRGEPAGVRIALEFQARSALGNNLQTAASLVEEVNSPYLGLCLDVFHFFTGPSKLNDLVYLTPANLFHVQVSDLADTARELASDRDRILPGDGDFQLDTLIERLRQIGYAGCVSLELMNPHIWQVPPLQLGEIAMTCLRKLLGQASME